jgi:hypothetical protein
MKKEPKITIKSDAFIFSPPFETLIVLRLVGF